MRYTIDDLNRYVQRFYGQNSVLVTPFGYPVMFSDVTVPQTINIQANADFLLMGLTYRALDPSSITNKVASALTLEMRESGSKEPFTDTPIILENYAGNGVLGRQLDYPRFLAGGTTVECVLADPFADGHTYQDGLEIYLSGCMVRVFNS